MLCDHKYMRPVRRSLQTTARDSGPLCCGHTGNYLSFCWIYRKRMERFFGGEGLMYSVVSPSEMASYGTSFWPPHFNLFPQNFGKNFRWNTLVFMLLL